MPQPTPPPPLPLLLNSPNPLPPLILPYPHPFICPNHCIPLKNHHPSPLPLFLSWVYLCLTLVRCWIQKHLLLHPRNLARLESTLKSGLVDLPVLFSPVTALSPITSPLIIPPTPLPGSLASDPNPIASLEVHFDQKFSLIVNTVAQLRPSIKVLMDKVSEKRANAVSVQRTTGIWRFAILKYQKAF